MNNIQVSHPVLKQIASDVYAWIGVNGDSNGGAITTSKGLVAIDAQQSEAQGLAFRTAVEAKTGLPVVKLVDTHFHLDHTAGNVVFEDVPIIAQTTTRKLMNEYMGTKDMARWNVADANQRLRLFFGSNFNELVPSHDPLYDWFLTRVQRPGLEKLELVAPNELFERHLALESSGGVFHLNYAGPAHCDGDVVVYLPTQKTAFFGDLLFVGRFPWLGDCDLDLWIECLKRLQALDLNSVVPGHGDVCTMKEVDEFRTLLMRLREEVHSQISAGASEEAAIQQVSLPEYDHLPRYREWLPSNVRSIYRYLKRG